MKIIVNFFLLFFLIFFSVVGHAQTPCEEFIKTYRVEQDACNPRLFHFTNLNTDATAVSWNFGDGSNGSTNETSHEYSNYGEYEVTMVVNFANGCTGEIAKKVPVYLLQDGDLISTESQTICPGQSIQLKTNASQNEFCWLSENGLNNITDRNPIVSPAVTTKYRFQTKYAGKNLVINSGFEGGNIGFTSEYEYWPITDSLEKQYAIITNSRDWHGGFESCTDHTPGGGNLMVVNGSPEPNAVVWSQVVSVTPNTNYEFALWIASVNKAFPAKLKFQINGIILDEKVYVGNGACDWNQFSTLWNSEGATTAVITIINVNTSVAGNDFALDDITFFPYNISYDEVTITVAPEAEINVSEDKTICKGESIQLSVTGGASYSWFPVAGLSDPNVANPVFSPNTTTIYTVTGISEFGCKDTAGLIINVVEQPVINLGLNVTYCEGGSYQIPGVSTNATNISWSPATGLSDATIANPIASPTTTITYTVTVTNGDCTAQEEITISVAEALVINTIEDQTFCGDTAIELTTTAVAGATYQWTPATGLSDATIASPVATLTAGTHNYKVTVTSADGCEGTDEVTITVNDNPTITIGEDAAYCIGGSYQIPGVATNATNINWSPTTGLSDATIANPIASPTTTTTYIVTATNGNCTAQEEITISVAEALVINTIEDQTFCGDTAIELTTTAVAGATYQWTPATGLSDATIASPVATLTAGTHNYKVTVTSADGCEGTDEVTITVNDNPTITIGEDAAYCIGGSYQIPGVSTNATNINWSPTTGLSDATIANPIASPTTTITYTVTVTNGDCTAQDEITIHVADPIKISTIDDVAFCGSTTVELTTNAIRGATYQWTPITGLSDAHVASPVANIKETTTYFVNVTTPGGCQAIDSVTVTIIKQPSINLGEDTAYCEGSFYQIPGIVNNATNISWSPSMGLSDAAIANPITSTRITTKYVVSATNGQCIARDSITINVASAVHVTPVNDTSICTGMSLQLEGTSLENATYEWFPATDLSDPSISNPIAKPGKTIMYTLTVTSADGCEGNDSVIVTVVDNPEITMTKDAMVCSGETITLKAQSPGVKNFKWWPQQGLSDSIGSTSIAIIHSTINYKVTATNSQGCESTDSVTITAAPLPIVNLIKSNDIDCSHGEVKLVASGGELYRWNPQSEQNVYNSHILTAKPRTSTEYLVTVTALNGCEATASVVVAVKGYPIEDFKIPTAFTPNRDGLNDCFGLKTANLSNPFQFEIYNRWGKKVFQTSNSSICWDGTLNGVSLPGDAYVWQIKVKGECGDLYKKGTVVLIR